MSVWARLPHKTQIRAERLCLSLSLSTAARCLSNPIHSPQRASKMTRTVKMSYGAQSCPSVRRPALAYGATCDNSQAPISSLTSNTSPQFVAGSRNTDRFAFHKRILQPAWVV